MKMRTSDALPGDSLETIDALIRLWRAVGRARNWAHLVGTFAGYAQRVPGVSSVVFLSNTKHVPGVGFIPAAGEHSCDVPAAANGRVWGLLTVGLENDGPCDQALAAMLGQQLGLALNWMAARTRNGELRQQLRLSSEDMATRKALHRACGVLCAKHGMDSGRAEAALRSVARRTGRPLLSVAEELVKGRRTPLHPSSTPQLSFDRDPIVTTARRPANILREETN